MWPLPILVDSNSIDIIIFTFTCLHLHTDGHVIFKTTYVNAMIFFTKGKVCTKNCTKKAESLVCGDDGRWYRNICALRQSKFCEGTGVREAESRRVCDTGVLLWTCKVRYFSCTISVAFLETISHHTLVCIVKSLALSSSNEALFL